MDGGTVGGLTSGEGGQCLNGYEASEWPPVNAWAQDEQVTGRAFYGARLEVSILVTGGRLGRLRTGLPSASPAAVRLPRLHFD